MFWKIQLRHTDLVGIILLFKKKKLIPISQSEAFFPVFTNSLYSKWFRFTTEQDHCLVLLLAFGFHIWYWMYLMSRCSMIFLVAVIASCNLQPFNSDLFRHNTLVWSWFNFIMKSVAKEWESMWAKTMYDNKRENTEMKLLRGCQQLKDSRENKKLWDTKEKAISLQVAIILVSYSYS